MDQFIFSAAEIARYNRHIIIPGFGMEAQEKLKKAKVLVVGAGGLGSPVLLYLAAAGIGTIGIVECDVVDDSNLQRQVLYGTADVGTAKAEAAKKRLLSLNPHIHIIIHDTELRSSNAMDIISAYDIVADGTDNFPTRYLVNDACVLMDKPNVYASIYQFEGQVAVFNYVDSSGERGPNYRDLYPVPPEPGEVANCSEAGVLGVLPGIIGSMQALEVIKIAAQTGDVLSGRLFLFDALSFETRTFNISRNPENPINGSNPTLRALIDYEQFCGVPAMEKKIKNVSPEQLQDWQEEGIVYQLIDVREQQEYDLVNLGGLLIPLDTIGDLPQKIDKDKKVVIHCKSGGRSAKAVRLLEEKYGFTNLYNLEGGLIAYIYALELDLPVY
ncbi:molybdopterin-synthase adenylyltransferase MoeB [Pedobacter sp. MR2016-24]|uniref:molybdopterin-synthase adenylyltransferase MoeB n=1 Tax=Pedobacter sp. MR2016-24 TaxID=2994466 RepID=UPI00224861D5|nr:molybdopterin-synthase adenylyltransferase MoeB [Pedobacter sp. MR2016-24]MCX2483440.1 molybdopterin-synthase adenylyltransferase MoeB [Pedobacter sp. MR2016-24]